MTHQDFTDYDAIPCVRSSMLKTMATQTPAHYFHKYLSGAQEEQTPSMVFGQMLHCAVLQPELFDERYTVAPEGIDRRTKEGKQLFADIEASGKVALKAAEFDLYKSLAASMMRTKIMQDAMRLGEREKIVVIDGRKVMLDLIVFPCDEYPRGLIVDLKTTRCAHQRAFSADCYKLGYDIQAAFYIDVVRDSFGFEPQFAFIAVEKTAPYLACEYFADDLMVDAGRKRYQNALDLINQCEQSGNWYGYQQHGAEHIGLPDWATDDLYSDNDE